MKQITIDDLISLLKTGYVAYEEVFGWHFFEKKPKASENCWDDIGIALDIFFNIAPFDGDWKDSLRRVGETKRNLTRNDIEKIMQSPKYWRDQDQKLLKIVSDWFDKQEE